MEEVIGRVVIIVQARLGSKRLPKKILKEVLGRPLLAYQLERLSKVKKADQLVVATPDLIRDVPIIDFCQELGIATFQGSEEDVLSRYYHAAKMNQADIVVRITSDCVLIDPVVIDEVIGAFVNSLEHVDYVSNCLERTYPVGMDTEVFSMQALESIYKIAQAPEDREHVTRYIYRHPEMFALKNISYAEGNFSHLHLAVDTEEDFKRIRNMIEELYPGNPCFSLDEMIQVLAGEGV